MGRARPRRPGQRARPATTRTAPSPTTATPRAGATLSGWIVRTSAQGQPHRTRRPHMHTYTHESYRAGSGPRAVLTRAGGQRARTR
eukprot:scaffold1881_cov62-Phaeocystis_antarctica.AAC.2